MTHYNQNYLLIFIVLSFNTDFQSCVLTVIGFDGWLF
jgi:hypothetical protein